MSQFLTPLIVEELGEDRWVLSVALIYKSDLNGKIIVPAGFETDLESVPRWLPLLYATLYGSAHAASVVHDWLYSMGTLPRPQADAVLYEAMRATGQPRWKSFSIWVGVRLGGWIAWNRHRKSEARQ